MKLEQMMDYDFFTYLVIGAFLLVIISGYYLATSIYERRKNKAYRLKITISSVFFLLSLSLVFYYYRPVVFTFQKPVSEHYDISVYKSQPNSTGGMTEVKYELSTQQYSQIIDTLDHVSLSRQIVDWNKKGHDEVQYDMLVIPLLREHNGIYLIEMRLYADSGHTYKSYLITSRDGRKQTYQIKDKTVIANLITELENLMRETVRPGLFH